MAGHDGARHGRHAARAARHQVRAVADGGVVFGLGSLQRVVFPLHVEAPDFERRCRKRGIDPEEVRRSVPR